MEGAGSELRRIEAMQLVKSLVHMLLVMGLIFFLLSISSPCM